MENLVTEDLLGLEDHLVSLTRAPIPGAQESPVDQSIQIKVDASNAKNLDTFRMNAPLINPKEMTTLDQRSLKTIPTHIQALTFSPICSLTP